MHCEVHDGELLLVQREQDLQELLDVNGMERETLLELGNYLLDLRLAFDFDNVGDECIILTSLRLIWILILESRLIDACRLL